MWAELRALPPKMTDFESEMYLLLVLLLLIHNRDSGRRHRIPKKCPETAKNQLGGRPLAGVYYTTASVFEKRHFQSQF